jgi:hypothetical protein
MGLLDRSTEASYDKSHLWPPLPPHQPLTASDCFVSSLHTLIQFSRRFSKRAPLQRERDSARESERDSARGLERERMGGGEGEGEKGMTDSSYRESLCAITCAGMTHATSVQQVFNLNVTR